MIYAAPGFPELIVHLIKLHVTHVQHTTTQLIAIKSNVTGNSAKNKENIVIINPSTLLFPGNQKNDL